MATDVRSQPLILDEFVNGEDPEPDLRKIFLKIRPQWTKEDKIELNPCPGSGFVNITLLATYDGKKADAVVVRIFIQNVYEFLMNRERELAATLVFNERGLTPNIYCIFKNGVCMDYIFGERFDWSVLAEKPLNDEKILRSVARELAKYHSKKTSDIAKEKYGHLFPMVPELKIKAEELLSNLPETLGETEADELFKTKFPSKALIESEWRDMFALMERTGVPLTLCHLDAHPSNMLYVPEDDRVIFVDYEVSAFSWPTQDLATFLEFSATGLVFDGNFPERHPPALRKMFLREYLETQRSLGDLDHDVTDHDVERLLVLVEKAVLPYFLFYTGCCLVVASGPERNGVPRKNMLQLSLNNYGWYMRNKERILALEVPQ
ncbi:ethanolamine kinase 1-like [Lineus longissimus]|uniref:ethanolamine kinase 1-like n=1 Tax=Lineus longissimus TaxID=88925 RepID=UPI002B4CE1AA